MIIHSTIRSEGSRYLQRRRACISINGEVTTVALIDKGSMLVAVLLAALILKEQITARTIAGAALMVAELLLIARK